MALEASHFHATGCGALHSDTYPLLFALGLALTSAIGAATSVDMTCFWLGVPKQSPGRRRRRENA